MKQRLKEFFIFMCISILGGIADLIVYFFLSFVIHYLVAGVIGFLVAMVINFFLNKKYTFKTSRHYKEEMYHYFSVSFLLLSIYQFFLYVGMEFLMEYFDGELWAEKVLSKLFASLVIVFLGYFLHKRVSFRHS